MQRLYILGAVIAALLGALGTYWVHSLYTENQALTLANTALAGRVQALQSLRASEAKQAAVHIKKLQALQQEREVSNAELSKATAENPDWAGERVPDGVLRALGL